MKSIDPRLAAIPAALTPLAIFTLGSMGVSDIATGLVTGALVALTILALAGPGGRLSRRG